MTTTVDKTTIISKLTEVSDPEIPVINVVEMGIIRKVENVDGHWTITITPTYSGCPAMKAIEDDISEVLNELDLKSFEVKTELIPPWTTDWITEEAKVKLLEYGISPPQHSSVDKSSITGSPKAVVCPQCKSTNTEMTSQFGSTACKSLYKCLDCLEPFDYFKCI